MGIADSRGVIYDFAGPYTIGEDNMAFGRPTRYLQLDPGRCKGEHWDEAVAHASETYRWVLLLGIVLVVCCWWWFVAVDGVGYILRVPSGPSTWHATFCRLPNPPAYVYDGIFCFYPA